MSNLMNSIMKWYLTLAALTVAIYALLFIIAPNGPHDGFAGILFAGMALLFAWLIFPLWFARFLFDRGHEGLFWLSLVAIFFGLGGVVTAIGLFILPFVWLTPRRD